MQSKSITCRSRSKDDAPYDLLLYVE